MAFVDLNTKKIYGTKEGSPTWYHEVGHIKFNESVTGNTFAFWKENIFVLMVISSAFAIAINNLYLRLLPMCLTILYVLMYFYEEAWCWGYSLKNKRGWNKNEYKRNN